MDFTTGLLETLYVYDQKIALEDFHKNRLSNGLELYNFSLDANIIFDELNKSIKRNEPKQKELKLSLQIFPTATASAINIQITEFSRAHLQPISLGFAADIFIDSMLSNNLKTSKRTVYNAALEQAQLKGLDDMIICNERCEIVETGIYNILWLCAETNSWFTPPLLSGCVAGVQRQYLLSTGKLQEKTCFPQDLLMAKSLLVCNALRGVLEVKELQY